MISTWLVATLLVTNAFWGGLLLYLIFLKDRGHFLFSVRTPEAQRALEELFMLCCGKKPFVTIGLGNKGTHPLSKQMVLSDRLTVLQHLRRDIEDEVLATGPAIPVDNPLESAQRAVGILQNHGFKADVYEFPVKLFPEGMFAAVRSDAFDGWNLIFRRSGPYLCRRIRGTFLHIYQ